MCACSVTSVMSNSATVWTVAHQTPLSMRFSRQEYWSGLPFPPPGDLPNLGFKPVSPALQADSLPTEPPGKPKLKIYWSIKQVTINFKRQNHEECMVSPQAS